VSVPPDLAEIVFRVLFSDHELIRVGHQYAVRCTGSLLVADSIGTLAQYISELHNPGVELAVLIVDETDPLPFRPK
jgi:hypothetical protein